LLKEGHKEIILISIILEAWVHTPVSPCGICGRQSGNGTGFSPSSSIFPFQYHSIEVLHTHNIINFGKILKCALFIAIPSIKHGKEECCANPNMTSSSVQNKCSCFV
jgi:hypothetical protein